MFARALSNFRSTSSLDVGGDKDDDDDGNSPAAAQEASTATEAVQASPIEEGAATGKIRVLYEPMRTWYGAPARAALKKKHGAYPVTPEALANWKSFGAVTTAFLDDQGVASTGAPAPARAASAAEPPAAAPPAAAPVTAPSAPPAPVAPQAPPAPEARGWFGWGTGGDPASPSPPLEGVVASSVSRAAAPPRNFCPSCGNRLADGANFCMACGRSVSS